MKKIIIVFAALLFVVQFSSCEDFLTVKPNNSVDADDFEIRTSSDALVMMNGIMRAMTSSSYYGRNMMLYADAKGGDFTIRSQGRGNDYLYTFNHSASSGSGSAYWYQIYYCLAQVNTLLTAMENAEQSADVLEDFSLFKGQALTLRALMHFDLVRMYGKPYTYSDAPSSYGVPIVTEALDALSQPTRATVAQVYTQILTDLSDAKTLLNTSAGKSANNGYISYYANRAIEARVYLTMGTYDQALIAAEEAMAGPYTLYTNTNWVSSWSSQFSTESIFEIGMFRNEADLGTASWGAYLLRRGEKTSITGMFMASDYYLARLDEGYDGSDPATKDIRWGLMFEDESTYGITGVTPRLGSCRKYTGADINGDGKGNYSAVNIKAIRLSEVYLIAAEAALLQPTPDRTKAATYLQEIRKRSPNLTPATAGNIDLDMILDERSKELFMEGQRYFDMLRHQRSIEFNDDFIDVGSIAESNRPKIINQNGEFFYKCILPIAINEIDANPPIGEQQNPGY